MTGGVGSAFDPFVLPPSALQYGNRSVSGRTARPARVEPGEATGAFLVAGQSNSGSFVNALYTSTNGTKIDQLSVFDGGVYDLAGVAIGPDGGNGNWYGQLADKLIAAGKYQRLIFCGVGVGGTTAAQWQAGGVLNPRLLVAARRFRALGIPISAVLWALGESDGQAGTTSAAFQASMLSVKSSLSADGVNVPWIVAKSTFVGGQAYPVIQGAIDQLVANNANVFAGPNTDTLTGANRYDTTHFSAAGADAAATLWRNAVVSALGI